MNPPPLHLVVALPAEAKPLNAHFGLQRCQPDGEFPRYRRGHLNLVLSGPGRAASAAACTWLQRASGDPNEALWLNTGIAGQRERPLGQALLASHIQGPDGASWSLPSAGAPLALDRLTTLDRPQPGYPQDCAYDLEAAGFYPAARRFAGAGRVHCLKVISDNAQHPLSEINGRRVRAWMAAQLPALEAVIRWLDPRVLAP